MFRGAVPEALEDRTYRLLQTESVILKLQDTLSNDLSTLGWWLGTHFVDLCVTV